jgi:signal transduction histidine kinase/HAMP domain-containing protein
MKTIFQSLSLKLTIVIVVVEVVGVALTGSYYVRHFSAQADARLQAQVRLPGVLMNNGILNYDAVSKRDTMKQIVGNELEEAMIFSYDKVVYQSINPADLGKSADQISRIDLHGFSSQAKVIEFSGTDYQGAYLASITPIYSAVGQAPFLFAYIKIHTFALQHEKQLLTLSVFGVSLFTAIITSLLIYYLLRILLFKNIYRLQTAAAMIGHGDIGPEVVEKLPKTQDELGQLSNAFRAMITRLQNTYRALAEREARLHASIDSLTLGFIMVDSKHQIININPAAMRLFDSLIDPGTPTLAKLETALKSGLDIGKTIAACIATKQPQEFKEVAFHNHFLHILFAPIVLSSPLTTDTLGVVMLFEDVTEERLLQRSRDEFFSIASHELRTPLTAIRGNTSMIKEYFTDSMKNVDLASMVGDIHDSSVRLIDIVNDFLDASSLEQGKMMLKSEAFDIGTVIESVLYEMASVSRDRHIALKCEMDFNTLPKVFADKNRIKQVIYNLLGNALKFTEQGSVTLAGEVAGKKLKVCVTDTGRGISKQNQLLLFRKFQQASDSLFTRDTTRGTGLGLYISKLLVEKMGGEVRLERSELGKGTTFSFTLPLAPEQTTK